MSRPRRLTSILVVSLAGVVATGCAARFEGELDGEPVPTFATAAYAVLAGAGASAIVHGVALPGDSCVEGAELLALRVARLEATSAERLREVNTDIAAFHARVLPRGAWTASLQVQTAGRNLLSDLGLDLDDEDTDADVSFSLCESDGDADPGDTDFVPDLDCSFATDGVVELALDDTAGTFSVDAVEPLTFTDSAGRGDGTLRMAIDFVVCPALEAPLAELIALTGGLPGTPQPLPGEPTDSTCERSCFVDANGAEVCETRCP